MRKFLLARINQREFKLMACDFKMSQAGWTVLIDYVRVCTRTISSKMYVCKYITAVRPYKYTLCTVHV